MRTITLVLVLVAGLAGCAEPVRRADWLPLTGSRADATMTLAYFYNPYLQKPLTSDEQALEVATQRCGAWGYSNAEPFGVVDERCAETDSKGVCEKKIVTRIYQCLGSGNSVPPIDNKPTKPNKPKAQ